tara:strand:+ start:1378 stop:2193 length:816 start_codon:yes stop_codon:yes gene_type:complete
MPVYSGTVGSAGGNYGGTFDGHGPEAWTDLNPNSFFKDPNILVPAADVTRHKEDQDMWDLYRRPREVIYSEVHNNITYKYRLSLVFFVAPAGATTLTIGGTGAGASGTIGRCLRDNATMLATAADTFATAVGFSLGKYFSVGVDDFGEAAIGDYAVTSLATDAFTVTTLTAGDGIWLVRSGRIPVHPSENLVVGSKLTFTAAGEVAIADIAIGGGPTEAEMDDLYGPSCIGVAISTGTATGDVLALADIHMPERYGNYTEEDHIPDSSPAA